MPSGILSIHGLCLLSMRNLHRSQHDCSPCSIQARGINFLIPPASPRIYKYWFYHNKLKGQEGHEDARTVSDKPAKAVWEMVGGGSTTTSTTSPGDLFKGFWRFGGFGLKASSRLEARGLVGLQRRKLNAIRHIERSRMASTYHEESSQKPA